GQELVGVEPGRLARRRDEPVALPAGEPGGDRAGGPDVDRDLLLGPVVDRRLVGPVVLPLEGHPLPGPELADEGHRLPQPGEALLAGGPRDAERRLVERLPRADTEDDATRVQAPEGGERLSDDGRVVAERRGEDGRAEDDALGAGTDRPEPGQRRGGVPAVVPPRLEVVGDERRLEPGLLGLDDVVRELLRRELLRRRLVPDPQHGSPSDGCPGQPLTPPRRAAPPGRCTRTAAG